VVTQIFFWHFAPPKRSYKMAWSYSQPHENEITVDRTSWLHPECGRSSWPEAEHAIWYVQT